ncbi:MAG: hypothetical protein J4432_04880, partial [DPANN group archaeon]|nr:hypothetical protein [DPANN group archaeon]
ISNKGGLTLYNLSSYTVTNATGGKIVLPSPVYKLVFTATDGIQTQTNEVNISYHERNKLVTGMLKWPITLQGEINLTTEIVPVEMFADSNISNNKNVTTYGVKEETLLAPNCLTQPDEHGFLDLRARAGVYDNDGNLFCSDTGVSVTIDGQTHGLKRYAGCTYAKLVQLPGGDYTATYEAEFLDHPKQQAVCTYTSEEESAADVIVYGIGRGSIVRAGQNITLEAVATVSRSKVSGATISVGLAEGDQVVEAKQMTENARGIHSAEMSIPTQPGEYSFVYLMEYQGFTATEIIGFTVTTDPAKVTLEEITLGNRMFIIYPQAKEYTVGQRLPLQVEVIDDRGAALTDITMVAEVYQNGALLDSVALPIHRDGFRALREFTQPANYDVVYKTVVQGVELSERVSFVMGEPTQIAQVAEFAIQVISPQEDVYAENSELIVRVQVTEQGSPVADANVKLVIDNTELQMAYDSFGEYETVIGPLESGEYNIRVVALKQNKVTEERITFIISDKFITLDVVNPVPKADLELELGQPVALRIKALDEASDVVSAVIVRGSILEPSGRKLTLQFTQDPVTGDYTSVFYPNDEGIYKIDVRATKPGFISDEISSTFNVNILVEETQPLTVDTSTVLTIVVALAIIIALITVIRMIL